LLTQVALPRRDAPKLAFSSHFAFDGPARE
jgi:hypothetical protein